MESTKSNISETGSSPVKSTAVPPQPTDEKSSVGSYFRMKSEKPTEPYTADSAFAQADTNDVSVGNPRYAAELTDEGKIGLFLSRERSLRTPTPITLNVVNYWAGIYRTLESAMRRLLRNKTEMGPQDIDDRITPVAQSLADGCCLMTYMKLRALLFIEFPDRYDSISLKRPKAHKDLPIPTPYAFAIQQLGAINAADLLQEFRAVPTLPDAGHRYGIPLDRVWNSNAYAEAVEYARNLGMQFAIVDLNKKSGTAWWLLRPHYAEEFFELQLPLPEVNFTNSMALTYSLFIFGEQENPTNPIFDLAPLQNRSFGYLLRNPHTGINVSTFEAIEEKAADVVAMV